MEHEKRLLGSVIFPSLPWPWALNIRFMLK